MGTKERNSDSNNSSVVRDDTYYDNEVLASTVVSVESGSSEPSAVEISSLRENGNAEKLVKRIFLLRQNFQHLLKGLPPLKHLIVQFLEKVILKRAWMSQI